MRAYTIGRRRAGYVIIDHEQNTWSNDIELGIQSSPLDNTHDMTTEGVACHHGPWETHTLGQSGASHANIALGQQI